MTGSGSDIVENWYQSKYGTGATSGAQTVANVYSNRYTNPLNTAKEESLSNRVEIDPNAYDPRIAELWGKTLLPDSKGFLTWGYNPAAAPVVLLGDAYGNVLRTTSTDSDSIKTGSPILYEEALGKIYQEYGSKPGGFLELKQELARLNYLSGSAAKASLSQGDIWDGNLSAALGDAIWAASQVNHAEAMRNPGQKTFLNFKEWLSTAPKYSGIGTGGGSGSPSTRVNRQVFSAEDFDIAIDELFQRTVGRGASKEELNFFVGQLQSYADANPQTTTSKVSGDKLITTTSGGVTSATVQSKMREQALSTQGAEEYNKATKYLNYFMDALSSPIKLG